MDPPTGEQRSKRASRDLIRSRLARGKKTRRTQRVRRAGLGEFVDDIAEQVADHRT